MTDTSISENGAAEKMQTMLVAFRQVGAPLLQALAEYTGTQGTELAAGLKTEEFAALVDSSVALSRALTDEIGGTEDDLGPAVRWALVGSASQIVGASYRSSGRAPGADDVAKFAEIARSLQEKFKTQIPSGGETLPNTVATFRSKMMEAMVPVIGAVAQYAFGRAEHELLADVAERLVKMADQVTRALADPSATAEQWRLLCWNILRAAGQIYTECHYAEADRLLYMNAEDRTAYFAQNGNIVPMTQVWQAFNQRMAMLATLATYLEVPAGAGLDKQGWP